MKPVVAIMAQGGMGAATAARLVERGIEVRTSLAGRSAASAERAAKAGMTAVPEDRLAEADFLLSIVPPAEAIPLARHLAPFLTRAAKKPVYVDLNAVNPDTAMMVTMVVQGTGAPFVDGGIIGGPPRQGYDGPVYYVSGPPAETVTALSEYGLKISVLDGPVGAASALKMSYAGLTKGLVALGASMILAAERAGVADALLAEMSASQATLLAGFTRSIPDMFAKANRWVAEMEEIAGFVGRDHAEGDLYAAVARLYARLGADFDGAQAETGTLKGFFAKGR
jgi:3-hydroxyisobutyrate dehydrogenase-like beta-hydroxyacid dehydrogenase